jgi:hypothetical protein
LVATGRRAVAHFAAVHRHDRQHQVPAPVMKTSFACTASSGVNGRSSTLKPASGRRRSG